MSNSRKKVKYKFTFCFITLLFGTIVCFGQDQRPITTDFKAPIEWKEHWFEHDKLVKKVYEDENIVMYHDENMSKTVQWPNETLSKTWAYVKKTYGAFGADPKLYVILHQVVDDKLGGGHPSPFFDRSHDFRNVIDCGLGDWRKPFGEQIGMPIHEIGHIVTSASHGVKGSPADLLWGDSKFMEIFNYDVLLHIGRADEAKKVFEDMQRQTDSFPRAGTQWFKNWFYPIYAQYGESKVLNKYFEQLALHFPKNKNNRFVRDLNWGEFIHFWSAAAGENLKPLATKAFGWTEDDETKFRQAQKDFRSIHYKDLVNN